jgi:hypothetical protein
MQITSPYSKVLDDSAHLMHILASHTGNWPFARQALARHQALHHELEVHQMKSEYALAEWRSALTHRWQCEIDGQRIYNTILQQTREHYGAESPEFQTIAPDTNHAGAATDLLNDMRHMHAALQLLEAAPLEQSMLTDLEHACQYLHDALTATRHHETRRRTTTLERQVIHSACERAIAETTSMLEAHLQGVKVNTAPPLEAMAYTNSAMASSTLA